MLGADVLLGAGRRVKQRKGSAKPSGRALCARFIVADNARQSLRGLPVAKPNYSFEKRQRELAKKKKKEEKASRKASPDAPEQQAEGGPAAAPGEATPALPPALPAGSAGQP